MSEPTKEIPDKINTIEENRPVNESSRSQTVARIETWNRFSDALLGHWTEASSIREMLERESDEVSHHTKVYNLVKERYISAVKHTPSIISPQKATTIYTDFKWGNHQALINNDGFKLIWELINDVFPIDSVEITDISLDSDEVVGENIDGPQEIYSSNISGIDIHFNRINRPDVRYTYSIPIGYRAICIGSECFCDSEGKLVKMYDVDGHTYTLTLASDVIPDQFKRKLLLAVSHEQP